DVWLCEYPGLSFQRSPVCACSLVSSLLLSGATMSQQPSLTQSAHSVRQVLTAYNRHRRNLDRERCTLASAANRKPRSVDGRSNRHSGVRSHPAIEARGGNAAGSEIHTTVETILSGLRTNPSTQWRQHDCAERSASPVTVAAFSWPCILPRWSARH